MNIQNRYTAILTNFNCENTIKESIVSILAQEIEPFELLISDDASSDNTVLILNAFKNSHTNISIIENDKNAGQSSGRNKCAEIAKTDYLVFFDDDDVSLAYRTGLHLKMFESGSDLNFVSSHKIYSEGYQASAINDEINPIVFSSKDMTGNLLLGEKTIGLEFYVPACTLAIKKSAYLKLGGFDESLRRLEDVDLALRATRQAMKFAFSSRVGVSRTYTIGTDKGGGIDAQYESVLLEKYRNEMSFWDFKCAKSWQQVRRFYFERNWSSLFRYSFSNPLVWIQLVLRIKVVTNRFRHDRIK
jgi:glycosyltransferase involved in cell wall biosynthesis